MRPALTRCPTLASTAGSSEIASSTDTITARAVPRPILVTNGMPIRNSPEIEIATVRPAKMTARPAVATAVTEASTGDRPSASPWRNRIRMNNV